MDLSELLELANKSKSFSVSYEDDKRVLVEFNKAGGECKRGELEIQGYSFEMGM